MREFFIRLLGLPQYIRGDFVVIRAGKGVGITIYKGKTDDSTLRRLAAQFFKIVHKL